MKLYELVDGLEIIELLDVDESTEILGITENSKEVKSGYLFVARRGIKSDGHFYVNDAIKNGASAILYETPLEI